LGFKSRDEKVAGFEILDLTELHCRRQLDGVHRVDFHTLTLVTGGSGEHAIDFVTHPCGPGTLLWVRPGQVQRFVRPGTTEGVHVLFTPAFVAGYSAADRLLNDWTGTGCQQLADRPEHPGLVTLVDQMRVEYARRPDEVSPEVLRLLLATVLIQVDRLPDPGGLPRARNEVYDRFRAELERSYASTRRAADYALRLGYTVKTLTRACMAATGQPVKRVIDDRVVLEAQRLLAHTDDPVSTIARRLGFAEPSNFVKFFSRQTGAAPTDFRLVHQG
jgi:AraC-like DNA-binding protein